MADLGYSPFSNSFVDPGETGGEMYYPLRVMVCETCWLAQLDYESPAQEHFNSRYVYFSSYSQSWLAHARRYSEDMIARFGLGPDSQVVEIASNDGYLLQYFVQAGIPCLGIEPSANTAKAAKEKGVESRTVFFGRQVAACLSEEGKKADLLIGNNVLAHVPNINEFVMALAETLNENGVVTLEFPYLPRLLRGCQFDTIYHEHYSYLSITPLVPVFRRAGMRLFDVAELPTHGGSVRLFACLENASHKDTGAVADLRARESAIHHAEVYNDFSGDIEKIRLDLLSFLIDAKRNNRRVAGYGAAAKGNTLLNYCGVRADMISVVADKNPAKQGLLLPGSRIRVCAPDELCRIRPDFVVIFPWNIKKEVTAELACIREWGGKFVTAVPSLEIW